MLFLINNSLKAFNWICWHEMEKKIHVYVLRHCPDILLTLVKTNTQSSCSVVTFPTAGQWECKAGRSEAGDKFFFKMLVKIVYHQKLTFINVSIGIWADVKLWLACTWHNTCGSGISTDVCTRWRILLLLLILPEAAGSNLLRDHD